MTAAQLIAALQLPAASRVDRRIPKNRLLQHSQPTSADKRRIADGIEQLHWLAALKPGTTGIASAADHAEIAVLHLQLRPGAALARLQELVHRAIPYPVLLLSELTGQTHLSLAPIRASLAEQGKTVLLGSPVSVAAPATGSAHAAAFASALALGQQPQQSLQAVYQGWLDTALALQAATLSGQFVILSSAQRRRARQQALADCERLRADISRLRKAAAREKQMARQVQINLELAQLRQQLGQAKAQL